MFSSMLFSKQRWLRKLCSIVAFAEIDWHDYAIVQTIEFTAADATSELPPPMSVQEVESMTLAQKRMAAMIMETTAEDVEAHRARQAAADAEAAAAAAAAGRAYCRFLLRPGQFHLADRAQRRFGVRHGRLGRAGGARQ